MTATILRFEPKGPASKALERWTCHFAADVETGDPAQEGLLYVNDTDHGLRAGVWEGAPFSSATAPYPVNEFLLLLDGAVTIVEENGRETTIGPGEGLILPKGLVCQWKQTSHVRKYFVIFDDRSGLLHDPKSLKPLRPDPGATLAQSPAPPPDLLLSPPPQQHARLYFEDPTGQWSVGIWSSTPYHRKTVPFPRYELMHLIEGAVTLTDSLGHAQRFVAGDTFFVPLGTECDWQSTEYVRKIYCIFQPNES